MQTVHKLLEEFFKDLGIHHQISKEQVIENFHMKSENIVQRLASYLNRAAVTMVCLQYLEVSWLGKGNCHSSRPVIHLAPQQIDILQYISGAIICKLRKRYKDGDTFFNVVDGLHKKKNQKLWAVCDQDHSYCKKTLIEQKSHGGLLEPCDSLLKTVMEMEVIFRQISHDPQTLTTDFFLQSCFNSVHLNKYFDDTFLQSDCTENEKNIVRGHITNLFFKIRSHHFCKNLMEELKQKKKATNMSKGLRMKLADKNTL